MDNLIPHRLLKDLGDLDIGGFAYYPEKFVAYCQKI